MTGSNMPKLLFGLVVVFGLFHLLAAALGSFRGESGIAVAAVVVTATVLVQRLFFDRSLAEAGRSVGLVKPHRVGVLIALAISLILVMVPGVLATATSTSFRLVANWPWLAVGMFFQAGIAEETLFRGYLYGYFRRRHLFWRAAALSAVPFVTVHLLIFFTLDWTIAAASVGLAVAMSFPLARLFDLGNGTIWAPALLHFTAQAGVKLVTVDGDAAAIFPFVWILACAAVPFLVFVRPSSRRSPSGPKRRTSARGER